MAWTLSNLMLSSAPASSMSILSRSSNASVKHAMCSRLSEKQRYSSLSRPPLPLPLPPAGRKSMFSRSLSLSSLLSKRCTFESFFNRPWVVVHAGPTKIETSRAKCRFRFFRAHCLFKTNDPGSRVVVSGFHFCRLISCGMAWFSSFSVSVPLPGNVFIS